MVKPLTFKDAEKEYYKLPYVEVDPLNERDVSDFVFRTESELILATEGGGFEEYSKGGINKLRKFVAKWKAHQHLKKDEA